MGKNFRTYSPDVAQTAPALAGQIGPLDEVDRWALGVIDEWDRERASAKEAARLALVGRKSPADDPGAAQGPQNAPAGQP